MKTPIYIPTFGTFDVAFVAGGLHHCIANLEVVLSNVAAMLKRRWPPSHDGAE